MEDWQKQLLDNVSNRKKQNYADTLKQNRLAEEEMRKATPEYKEQKQKDQLKDQLKTRRELQEEKRKSTPQEDILRFGQQQKKFRDLAYKERVLTETDDKGTEDESDDETKVSMQYVARPGGAIFKQQEEAYSDSLKLAGLAQQYGARTPDIRKIDRNRKEIGEERTRIAGEKWKQLMTQKLPMRPGADGTYSEVTDKEKFEMANDIANEELVKKYGKGIIPLLTALANR